MKFPCTSHPTEVYRHSLLKDYCYSYTPRSLPLFMSSYMCSWNHAFWLTIHLQDEQWQDNKVGLGTRYACRLGTLQSEQFSAEKPVKTSRQPPTITFCSNFCGTSDFRPTLPSAYLGFSVNDPSHPSSVALVPPRFPFVSASQPLHHLRHERLCCLYGQKGPRLLRWSEVPY